jgi:prolycopene isomerase
MENSALPRREFLRMLAAAFPAAAIDWDAFPVGPGRAKDNDKPGGFATAFSRPGGFLFDVSLHSTTVGERNGVRNLINGFPEITEVEFLPHPSLFRAIYPNYDIRVPQRDTGAYIGILTKLFPEDKEAIAGIFADMQGLSQDIGRLSAAGGNVDMSRFTVDFPHLARFNGKTWGEMLETRVKNPKLQAVMSGQWGYYGLPPSKLSCYYYALPFIGYLTQGGYYPKGRSQDISNALAKYIEAHGGKILLGTKVDRVLLKNGVATGAATADGRQFKSRVVVSNTNPFDLFRKMIGDKEVLAGEEAKWKNYSVSLSCFQVFLGLKKDLVKELGITDSEIFLEPSYDPETGYAGALKGDVEHGGIGISLYDNIYHGYSPEGKNTVGLLTLQGYGPWEKFENDYAAGNKEEYRKEKERMAEILTQRVEKALLPGLSRSIEVRDASTPLTVVRYTGHHRGAIYGWDQTVNNSGNARVGHGTPIKNLYLAGAWSRPGHGYGAVIPSGLECFSEIMKKW